IRHKKHQRNKLLKEHSASTNEVSTNEVSTNELSTNELFTNEVFTNKISNNRVCTANEEMLIDETIITHKEHLQRT
ncbi:7670_t:CDS:1, partial [Dentiscutata erythropus]